MTTHESPAQAPQRTHPPQPAPGSAHRDAEAQHLARSFQPKPLSILRAEGSWLVAPDGRRFVDLGGASHGVANFGHNHPRIVAAIREQAQQLVYVSQTTPSPARAGFLDRLHRLLPSHLARSFLANSGTEAVECALKHAATATGRRRFVALRGAFHGRTLGSLGATHRPQYRAPFAGLVPTVDFVSVGDVEALDQAVTHETAAVLVEPVQGEGGVHVVLDAFLRDCQRVAHERGALLVVDEIQTGLGRTGRDLAIEHSGVRPDLLTLGKGLAGGLPVGVCSMTDDVASRMPPGGHGTTFGGSPLVCAAGSAALDVLRDERLSQRAHEEGERAMAVLGSMPSPLVREVRGRGLMLGVDLRVKNQPVLDALLQRGWLALAAGPTVVRFLPPLTIDRADLDAGLAALEDALATVRATPGDAASHAAVRA